MFGAVSGVLWANPLGNGLPKRQATPMILGACLGAGAAVPGSMSPLLPPPLPIIHEHCVSQCVFMEVALVCVCVCVCHCVCVCVCVCVCSTCVCVCM